MKTKQWKYTKGLQELEKGVYAYLCPDGPWGFNNAGLIVDGEASLLVDTLFDLALTRGDARSNESSHKSGRFH